MTPPAIRMPELGPCGGWAPTYSSTRPSAHSEPPGIGVRLPRPASLQQGLGAWAENLPLLNTGAIGKNQDFQEPARPGVPNSGYAVRDTTPSFNRNTDS